MPRTAFTSSVETGSSIAATMPENGGTTPRRSPGEPSSTETGNPTWVRDRGSLSHEPTTGVTHQHGAVDVHRVEERDDVVRERRQVVPVRRLVAVAVPSLGHREHAMISGEVRQHRLEEAV